MNKVILLCHWIFAHLFGYFWQACARCNRRFGGHQVAKFARMGMLGTCRDLTKPLPCPGLVLCQHCCQEGYEGNRILRAHLNYAKHLEYAVDPSVNFALLSGMVWFISDDQSIGMPPERLMDVRFFARLAVTASCIVWLFIILQMILPNSPWTNVGAALGFCLNLAVFRMRPPMPLRPLVNVAVCLVTITTIILLLLLARLKVRGML